MHTFESIEKDLLSNNRPRDWAYHRIRKLNRTANAFMIKLPCASCGYDKHVELCHIRPIKNFSRSVSVDIINASENVVQLCRNCHWEFDHGELSLDYAQLNKRDPEDYSVNQIRVVTPKTKKRYYGTCKCGAEICKGSQCCRSCASNKQERFEWPLDEELAKSVWDTPRSQLAKQWGVSDKAIANRCKRRGIDMPSRGYWQKIRHMDGGT